MPSKPKHMCNRPGCPNLTSNRFCEEHTKQDQQYRDQRRGSAHERGYTSRWRRYSQSFLGKPENVFCKLQLPGCTNISECVDHIDPPNGPDDQRFWEPKNHQGACIHCNSVKGHRKMVGNSKPFGGL